MHLCYILVCTYPKQILKLMPRKEKKRVEIPVGAKSMPFWKVWRGSEGVVALRWEGTWSID